MIDGEAPRMTFAPAISLTAAMADPNLFGKVFANPTYWTWKVVAKLIDGIPLSEPREIELFETCTGRKYNRQARRQFRRLIILAGRRAGKDRFLSAVAVWRACLCANWKKHISAGEQAVVILLGADKKQGNILSKYCTGLIEAPMIAAEVTRNVMDVIEFKNGSSLEISTNDARLVRGRSAIAVLGSECCHWKTGDHAASSDEEVIGAAEPSMAMIPDGGLMLMGSSVHRKRGYMYRRWKELFGNDDAEDLVWFAPSQVMNPRLSNAVVDKALASDSARGKAEYLNEWRTDLSDCYPPDTIDSATDIDIYERAPISNVTYYAHADAAGGTGKDSFAFAISHREASYVVDVVREYKPRFVPAAVIAELSALCKLYKITKVYGDKYAIGFHSREWQSHGIEFVPCESTTSENYLTCLPLMLAGRVRLVDNKTLRAQLGALERKPGDGRETVTHPQHDAAHDDVACAVCGSIVAAASVVVCDIEQLHRMNGTDDKSLALARFGRETAAQQTPGRVECGNGGYWIPSIEKQWQLAAEQRERERALAEFGKAVQSGEIK